MTLVIKNLPASAGDIRNAVSIPGSRRSPAGGHGNSLQYSCLENLLPREFLPREEPGGLQSYSIFRFTEKYGRRGNLHLYTNDL